MLHLPADILRLIGSYIPHNHRALRLSCQRMRTLLPVKKLSLLKLDIRKLCYAGEVFVLQLYPQRVIHQVNKEKKLCAIASKYNHLELLKWLRRIGISWDEDTVANATAKKNSDLLKWSIENGCPFGWVTYYYAARQNNVELLRYLLSRAPSTDNRPGSGIYGMFTGAAKEGHLSIFREFRSLISRWQAQYINVAGHNNHFELVKWLHREGCPFDENTFSSMVHANVEILQWLQENGCSWNSEVTRQAACVGNLESLQWLIKNGCPTYSTISDNAASSGNIEMVHWLRQQGYEITGETMIEAAINGQLKCVQWLREQGCPWDKQVCSRASGMSHLNVLKWARANGCPWNRQDCLSRAFGPEVIDWIKSQPD